MAASVVTKLSMVHMLGWIMPEPLHMPPMVTRTPPSSSCTAASLFFVSVVMMALEAAVPLSGPASRRGAMALIPASIRSMGSCFPITPVDATKTPSCGIPRTWAAVAAVRLQYSMPSSPVQALAIPALMTTAWAAAPPVT